MQTEIEIQEQHIEVFLDERIFDFSIWNTNLLCMKIDLTMHPKGGSFQHMRTF